MMKEREKKKATNFLYIAMCFILSFGLVRFFYSILKVKSLFQPTYIEAVYRLMVVAQQDGIIMERRWGPLFAIAVTGLKTFIPTAYFSFIWRVFLLIAYGLIIYFFLRIISAFKNTLQRKNTNLWSFILVFSMLQFASAIYNVTNGGGEIFITLFIVGQFYYFYNKKYFIAALFIVLGIYFKLFPVVFAFPYFIFSICSKNHRRYAFYLILAGVVISLAGFLPWASKADLFYPFSMIFSITREPSNTLPIWSKEIFSPLFFINKIMTGFQIPQEDVSMSRSINNIAFVFTIMLFVSSLFAGWKLSRLENRWSRNPQLRFLHLFIFQVVIGFIFLTFSLEIAIEHILLSIVSVFSPLYIFSARIHKISDINLSWIKYMLSYLFGICLAGGLLPLSLLNRILLLNWIHQISGNPPDSLILYEKYIWYHVPMFGIYIIALVFYFSARSLINDMNKVS